MSCEVVTVPRVAARRGVAAIALALSLTCVRAAAAQDVAVGPVSLLRSKHDATGLDVKVMDLALFRLFGVESTPEGRLSWDLVATPILRLAAFGGENDQHRHLDLLAIPGLGGVYQWSRQGERSCHRVLFVIHGCLGSRDENGGD